MGDLRKCGEDAKGNIEILKLNDSVKGLWVITKKREETVLYNTSILNVGVTLYFIRKQVGK